MALHNRAQPRGVERYGVLFDEKVNSFPSLYTCCSDQPQINFNLDNTINPKSTWYLRHASTPSPITNPCCLLAYFPLLPICLSSFFTLSRLNSPILYQSPSFESYSTDRAHRFSVQTSSSRRANSRTGQRHTQGIPAWCASDWTWAALLLLFLGPAKTAGVAESFAARWTFAPFG